MALAIYIMSKGWTPWFFVSFAIYFVIANIFTAVYHRYYTHNAFRANEKVMYGLAWICGLYFYPSLAIMALNHSAHHGLADTEHDNHVRGWWGFFIKNHNDPPSQYFPVAHRVLRDPKQVWMHNNIINIQLSFALLLYLVLPENWFYYGYAIPIFICHFFGRLQINFAHANGRPCNRWYLEYLLPMAGEWLHVNHHKKFNASSVKFGDKWYELDTGYWFSKLLMLTYRKKAQ
jgi:stearoyl-CoA desaturase (delta-9 desaturase)